MMKFTSIIATVYQLVILSLVPVGTFQNFSRERPSDATLEFPQLAHKYGFKVEEHNVTTEDGYILKMFHIPGNKNNSVLIMHGFLDSADSFIIRGRQSLAAVLVERGYDVWLGNTRGNRYSRAHQRLNPDTDKEFWDFSFHEMGVIDLPAFIEFIVQENGIEKLSLIGHSLGNTLFYVLGSVKPEYNDKVNVAIALGPACYLNYDNYDNSLYFIFNIGSLINRFLVDTNQEELFGDDFILKGLIENICERRELGYRICGAGVLSEIAGEDLQEFEPEFFYSVIGHYPTSTSRKNGYHLLQLGMRKEFAQFDYGPENNSVTYKSTISPQYDLKKVTMKVALFAGKNDKLTPLNNVLILKNELPNLVSFHVMEREKFNHIDYIWGKNMNKYLFPHIFKLLSTYN